METKQKESYRWLYLVAILALVLTAIALFVVVFRPELIIPNEVRVQRKMRTPITVVRLPQEEEIAGYALSIQSTGFSLEEVQEKAKDHELLIREHTPACYAKGEVIKVYYNHPELSALGSIHLYGSLQVPASDVNEDVFGFYLRDRQNHQSFVPLMHLVDVTPDCRIVSMLSVLGEKSVIPWDK